MSVSKNDDAPDSSVVPGHDQSRILSRFESAWQSSLQSGKAPEIDDFLNGVPKPHLPAMRKALAATDQKYRSRLSGLSAKQNHSESADTENFTQQGTGKVQPDVSSGGDDGPEESAPGKIGAPHDSLYAVAGETIDPVVPAVGGAIPGDVDANASSDADEKDPSDSQSDPSFLQTVEFDPSMQIEPEPQTSDSDLRTFIKEPAATAKTPAEILASDSSRADGDGGSSDADSVPGYEISGELGRGGMGVVYRARQTALNRIVALKMILAGGHASEDQLARFRAEAESVARLQHPNIVQIYDVGEQRGLPYFSLEFIDGKSLEDEIDGKPMAFNKAAGWMETIATAMYYAHEQGIVHRDLKPANILLTSDGVPKITDFGLAKNLESESSQTRTGTIMGTPSYMAPEQGRGTKHVGPLADVYALGAILYEMATGRPPFLAATAFQTLMLLLKEEPVRPLQLRPDIPADLETIILKCLQKDSGKRYANAEDLALDLHRFLVGEPILARPVGRVERAWRWCRRNRLVAGLTATAVVLLLGLAIGGSTAAVLVNEQRKIAVQQTALAEKSKQRALDHERRAVENEVKAISSAREARIAQKLAIENEEKAVNSAREARNAQKRAEFNAKVAKQQGQLALQTLNSLVTNVQTQLKDTAGTFELKRNLLQTALDGLRKVARTEKIDGYNADISIAVAHQRMGKILEYLGKPDEARDEYEQFHKVIVAVSGPNPSLRAKGNLAISLSTLGDVSLLLGERERAWGYYSQSHRLREEVAGQNADDGRAQVRLATSFVKLGDAGDRAQAEEFYFKALSLRKELAEKSADKNRRSRLRDVWIVHNKIADWSLRKDTATGEMFDQAEAHFRDGFKIASALHEQNRTSPQARQDLSTSYINNGNLALRQGDDDGAQREYNSALELLESVAREDSENIDVQGSYALLLARCRRHEQAAEKAEGLREMAPRVYRNLYNVACCYSLCAGAADTVELTQTYTQNALDTLEEAIKNGLHDPNYLQIDPDLEAIRSEERFGKLIELAVQSATVTD